MNQAFARRTTAIYLFSALALAVAAFMVGRRMGESPLLGGLPAVRSALPPDPALPRTEPEQVVVAQRKRIMGRLRTLEHVRRVTTHVRPLVDRALEAPSLQDDIQRLASIHQMPVHAFEEYFKDKQEADLLLESGGDPNARSISDAIGVAQFLAGTGRRCGLRVDLGASNALSRKIGALESDIAWLERQPEGWSAPVPGMTATWSREQWLSRRRRQRRELLAKRRRVDERFDPAKAIAAQTRYLLRLTRRYGGVDWALQAYHGGEGGASRTMRLFAEAVGQRGLLASRGTAAPGWVPYSELYRRVTPLGTPSAFSYLFGRSDDHRYYWWKVLMAERALEAYREDPEAFEREWMALRPGYSADTVFYPDVAEHQFPDEAALREAYRHGALVPLPKNAAELGIRTHDLAELRPQSAMLFKGLRPEAMGALLRLSRLYATSGGQEPLLVSGMVQCTDYRMLWNTRYPPKPLPRGVPRDPEYHTTGLVFDLKRPAGDWSRKVLEFSLGRLYDTLRISWRKEEGGYHVVVNPQFREEMVEYYRRAVR